MPFVSVILPVRNEQAYIAKSLNAVLEQTYPADRMEILVVDGMSTDATREIVNAIAETAKTPINIVDNPGEIAPKALNLGLARARGAVIIRVDGHCEIEPDYVQSCVSLLQSGRAEAVGGPIETIGETERAKAIAIAMSSSFGVGGSAFRTINDREMYTDTVAFPGYTREIIESVGPFNEELVRNQDDEYNFRIRKNGGRVLLSPTIRSRYVSRSNFKALWRQYFQYGYWKVRVLQMHPKQMSPRQFVPFAFVFSLLFLLAISLISPYGIWGLILIITLYLVASSVAVFGITKIKELRIAVFLALAYVFIHLSYGLGFMLGLIVFANRWFPRRTA